MAGRASIVGAAATHVGKVRDHNEDAHFFDTDLGLFLVCDGMGGHAAGEVASAIAIRTIRAEWEKDATQKVADAWLERGTPEARKQLFTTLRDGVIAAHDAILAEAAEDEAKAGMGTTLVGAMIVGNELVFAHAGDSRAYLVRDGIAMQLTEDHTLLARLLAAGIEVDVSGEGSRFRSMLTNALGIGRECRVATFVVPLADGDRFLLCSDGISEYVAEAEVGTVLTKQPSPARAAQKLIELALERGGGDNATAVVARVLEAGETPQPAEQRRRDDAAIDGCALWGAKVTPQQRLRALRVAIPRDHAPSDRLPAHTLGDRVAWIIVEGELVQGGKPVGAGALIYPESLISDGPMPDRDALAIARTEVRALALRADDFRELCEDDSELGEALLETLARLVGRRGGRGTQPPAPDSGLLEEPTKPELGQPLPRVPMPAQSAVAAPIMTPRAASAGPSPRGAVPRVEPRGSTPGSPGAPAESRYWDRPPTEPEIEAIYELEAEPPPLPTGEPAEEPDDIEEMTVSVEDGRGRVVEVVTDTSSQTLTVTIDEPVDEQPARNRAITAEDSAAVSGTISVPTSPPDPPRRPKRPSET